MGELNQSKEKNVTATTPHDAMFKELFSDKTIAEDFIKNNLPEELLQVIDMQSMKLSKDSFINEDLKETFSDLIYTVNMNGKEGYISFLLEHKSYPDKKTIIQVGRYIFEIWMTDLAKEGTDATLTWVVPIVVYHGRQKNWNYRTDIRDMIAGFYEFPETLRRMQPVYSYELINLMKPKDEELIKYRALTRFVIQPLRHVFDEDINILVEILVLSIDELSSEESEEVIRNYLEIVFTYYKMANKELTEEMLRAKIEELGGRGSMIMTILDEREVKGIQKGREEGREEAKILIAKNLLDVLDVEIIAKKTGLTIEEIKKMQSEKEYKGSDPGKKV